MEEKRKTDDEIRDIVRKRILDLRLEAGLNQDEFGKPFGKKKHAVAAWEQGRSLPDIQTLYRISKHYHKTLDFMFGEERKVKCENRKTAIRDILSPKKN